MDDLKQRIARLTPERRELLRRLAPDDYDALIAIETATDETESQLVAIWSEVLGVAVGRDDNYFELGGDSILSVSIVAKARAAGLPLTPRLLFAYPSVALLAEALRRTSAVDDDASGAVAAVDAAPLTPLQQGMVFHSLLDPGRAAYVSQLSCVLPSTLDRERVAHAWREVTRRHDVLRAAVDLGDPLAPRLRAFHDAAPQIEDRTLEGDTPEALRRSLDAFLRADLEREFDLASPPLMRLTLLRGAHGECRCVWTHHHLLLDGWSQLIVLQEFQALYLGAALPPVTTRFLDYATWLARQGNEHTERFWRDHLRDAAPTRLPRGSESASASASGSEPAEVQAALVARFRREDLDLPAAAQRFRVSVAVLLEAAWALCLSELAGHGDVAFGLTATVRPTELADSDRIVGLCINTLPMRIRIAADGTVADWLASLQETQREWLHHAHAALPDVLRWTQSPKDLFDTLLVFENLPRLSSQSGPSPVHGMEEIRSTVREHYPMVLVVTPGDAFAAELKYLPAAVRLEQAERTLALFEDALRALAGSAEMPAAVSRLRAASDERMRATRDRRAVDDHKRLIGARRVAVSGDGAER